MRCGANGVEVLKVRNRQINQGDILHGSHHRSKVPVFQPEHIPQHVALLLANGAGQLAFIHQRQNIFNAGHCRGRTKRQQAQHPIGRPRQ